MKLPCKNNTGYSFYNKHYILYLLLVVVFVGCNLIGTRSQSNYKGIYLSTNKTQFSVNDSIYVTLINNSDTTIHFPLLCGSILTFYYEQKVNNKWSGAKYFPNLYTQLCASFPGSLKSHSKSESIIPPQSFNNSGIFRLACDYYTTNKHNEIALSKEFTVIK